jgi:hypothetical protein
VAGSPAVLATDVVQQDRHESSGPAVVDVKPLAVEVPPLPLPRAGQYIFRLTVNGNVLGEAALFAQGPGTTR